VDDVDAVLVHCRTPGIHLTHPTCINHTQQFKHLC
jgi:hypothetical protein